MLFRSSKKFIQLGAADPYPRTRALETNLKERHFVDELVEKLPTSKAPIGLGAIESAEYLNLLEDALADRHLDRTEVEDLIELAQELRLNVSEIESIHKQYIRRLCDGAFSDGDLTAKVLLDIQKVAELLRIANWKSIVEEAARRIGDSVEHPLKGTKICFTGTMSMSRSDIESLAEESGLIVMGAVSRKVDFLVVADPFSESTKARKAREFGTQILSEKAFLELISVH